MMFRVIIFIAMILLILIIGFDVFKLKKFDFIKKVKNKKLQWAIALLPIVIISLLFNYVNVFVILIHLAIFFLLSDLLVYLIKKVFKKEFKFYLSGILAISCTIIYLGIAFYIAHNVVETKYTLFTEKEIGEGFKIVLLSDSHVGTTFDGNGFYKHMEEISKVDSDILIIDGDYVDDDTTKIDMIRACEGLGLAKPKYGVYFIYGNHDKGYFNTRDFTYKDLENELKKNNVIILEDEIKEINEYITIIGRKDKSDKTRKSIQDLTMNLDKNKYIISINHQPNDYDNEMNNVDLVLSGHSHGGQMFPLAYFGKLTKANDEFYGLHTRGNTNFIVTSGISGWRAGFKTGAKSEYIVVEIKKKVN